LLFYPEEDRVVFPSGGNVVCGDVYADGYTQVDLSDIPAGVYLIAVIAGDRTLARYGGMSAGGNTPNAIR
jgi:hypothetical protein